MPEESEIKHGLMLNSVNSDAAEHKPESEMARQLMKYADLVTGFSAAQAIAFCYTVLKGEPPVVAAIHKGWWLMLPLIIITTWFYIFLARKASVEEGKMRQSAMHGDAVMSAGRTIAKWRDWIIGLAGAISFISVAVTSI